MHRKISNVRDLELIEKELNNSSGGILAFNVDGEKVAQYLTTFLYHDKNIYFFLEKEEEIYEKIHFNNFASFTVLKDDKLRKRKAGSYHLFSASITGMLKIVDEKKAIEDIKHRYLTKYGLRKFGDGRSTHTKELIMIDSEEIQAVEEEGA